MLSNDLELKPALQLQCSYKWRALGLGRAIGPTTRDGKQHEVVMTRDTDGDGVTWTPRTTSSNEAVRDDVKRMAKRARSHGLTFESHPLTTTILWGPTPATRSKAIGQAAEAGSKSLRTKRAQQQDRTPGARRSQISMG